MSLWVMFDVDLLDDPQFISLSAANPAYPWQWMRIIQFAKRCNEKGRVLRADGHPVTARDLALTHDRSTSTEQAWEDLLAACVREGLLTEADGAYTVSDWRRWHRKPSDLPEAVKERVGRHRSGGVTGRYETPGNACNASKHSKAENSKAPPCSPPTGDGGGDVSVPPANGKRSWSREVVATLAEHLPGDLSTQDRQAICRIAETGLRVGATPLRSLEAIRKHAFEVAYETQFPDHGIHYPRQVALKRALLDIESNPDGPVPHPWDVDSRRGDQPA